MSDLISIIVPVYKVEEYIEKCIDSLLCQTYRNIEIVLVDDGSPDRCPQICDKYAQKDRRIKVIHQKNGGLSVARNSGIEASNGNYIMFVDSDDYVEDIYVEQLYKEIVKSNSDIALCNVNYVNEHNKHISGIEFEIINEVWNFEEFWEQYYSQNTLLTVVAWNKIYKKDLFKNQRYSVGKIHEDEFIIHHLVNSNVRVAVVPVKLYYYRRRKDSIMGTDFNICNLDGIEAMLDRSITMRCKNEMGWAKMAMNKAFYLLLKSKIYLDMNNSDIKNRYDKLKKDFTNEYNCMAAQMDKKSKLKIRLFIFNDSVYVFIYKIWLRYVRGQQI